MAAWLACVPPLASATPVTPPPGCPQAPAPAQDIARQILESACWARFTLNAIKACGDGHDSLIGGDALSDGERDALLELCRHRLDAFRELRGEEVFTHRSRHRSPISGSVKTGRLRHHQQPAGALLPLQRRQARRLFAYARGRTDFRGVQASYGHREAGCVFCALESSGRVLLENELSLCIAVADLVIEGQAMSFQSCAPRAMGSCQVHR